MTDIGKAMIFIGGAILVIGVVILVAARLGFKGLPGDMTYQGESFRFYFPAVSCIVLSMLLTLGVWIFRWLSGR
jgi:hypothetical protein